MDPFVQMLRAAQGGQGIDNLARLYGLSAQQAQTATEVLMPAFAAGFQNAMRSPESMAALMSLMMRGPYASLYNQAGGSRDLTQAGTDALSAVLGSSDVSRAVAQHAAASTGLGVAVVRQMMPAYATLVLGGLTKSLAASGALQQMLAGLIGRAQGLPPAPASSGNPWVDAFTRMMSPGGGGSGNPWADAFAQTMMRAQAPRRPDMSSGAWQDVVNAMSATMAQAGLQSGLPAPRPAAPPPPPAQAPLPFQDFFAQMFALGYPPKAPEPVPAPVPAGSGSPWSTQPPASLYSLPEFWRDMMNIAAAAATARPDDTKVPPLPKP